MRGLLTMCAVVGLAVGTAVAADKSADEIVKEIEGIKAPSLDREKARDKEAVAAFLKERAAVNERKIELIGELVKKDPSHKALVALLPQRWVPMVKSPADFPKVAKDAAEIQAATKNPEIKTLAAYFKAQTTILGGAKDDEAMAVAGEFAKLAPKDARVASILNMAADRLKDEAKATEVRKRILADFPDSPVARSIKGALKQSEAVGKPFELAFEDAIKGTKISMASLKGKVVVIDFWATWCGPCIAEMPKMKELYAKYRDQGVEFIGVSLDQPKEQGGLDALKKYVADNKVEWPQYYQGNYWQSEFSSGWGVNSIPCVFIVAADGNLHSVKARGKLDTLIPELIAKRKADRP